MKYKDEKDIKLLKEADKVIDALPSFAKKFFDYLDASNMSPSTIKQYAYDMEKFFAYLKDNGFKNADMNSLTASDVLDVLTIDDINEYAKTLKTYTVKGKDGKEETRISSASIRARRMSSLRSFYKHYYELGEIKNNLSTLIPVPEVHDKEVIVLDKDQVKRLLNAIKSPTGLNEAQLKKRKNVELRDYAIMMLLFGTGLRVSELVGIDLSDVDLYNASIKVLRKGGDEDLVYFGPEVEDALVEYIEAERPRYSLDSDEALFLSNRRKRMEVRTVELMVKKYQKEAGLNVKVTPHTLRRTYGTNLYEETGDIYLVADALHHASVDTTRKHYAKMSEEHKRIAQAKSSSLFKD